MKTQYAGHAGLLAKEAASSLLFISSSCHIGDTIISKACSIDGVKAIIAIGGDGTVNEALQFDSEPRSNPDPIPNPSLRLTLTPTLTLTTTDAMTRS